MSVQSECFFLFLFFQLSYVGQLDQVMGRVVIIVLNAPYSTSQDSEGSERCSGE